MVFKVEDKPRFPRLRRLFEWVSYAKKAIWASGLGTAGAVGVTLSEPDVTGLPLWLNALIAAILAFFTTYLPRNGARPSGPIE